MRGFFPGHFPKDEIAHKSLWGKCLFVFDANILLNMYRYSDETRSDFLKILDKFNERIWIPHRVAEEYLANRLKVISEQQEEYSAAISDVSVLSKKLESPRQHPFVSDEVMSSVNNSLEILVKELESNRDVHGKRMHDDEIMSRLAIMFDGRVGRELDNAELEEIIVDGEKRYAEKIPPGYSDAKKASSDDFLSSRCRPYGDFIVWKQIIEKSKELKVPVIFVTDDGKEDWWLRFKGKTIGPRPELIKEFVLATSMDFHMYHPERFLSLAGDFLEQETSVDVLNEIRDLRVKEKIAEAKIFAESNIVTASKHYERLLRQQEELMHEYSYFTDKVESLRDNISNVTAMRDAARSAGKDFISRFTGYDVQSADEFQSYKADYELFDTRLIALQEEFNSVVRIIDELKDKLRVTSERIEGQRHYGFGRNITIDDL